MDFRKHKRKIIPAVVVVAAAVLFMLLPLALRPAIELAIHSNGFPKAKVGQVRFLPSGILIENINLDKDGFSTVENIQITGPWKELILDHKADKVSVKSVNLSGELDKENRLTIAGWDGQFKAGPSDGENSTSLPFTSFYLDGMTVDLETPVGGLRTQGKAIFEKNPAGGQTFTATIFAAQKIFSTNINLNGSVSANGIFSGKADIQDTSIDIAPVMASRVSGWVEFKSGASITAAGQLMAGALKYNDMAFQDANLTFDTTQDSPALFKTQMAGHNIQINAEWVEKPERKVIATISAPNFGELAALNNIKNDLLSNSGPIEIGLDVKIGEGFQPDHKVNIHKVETKFAGGLVTLNPFTWEMESQKNNFAVNLKGIKLAELGKQSKSIVVDGSISGTVPVRLEGKEIYIDNAVLTSDQPGYIKYEPAELPAPLQGDDPRMQTVRQALSNYNYESLQIDIDGPVNGDLKTIFSAKGTSPAFQNRAVNLNLNLQGALISAVTQALQPGALADKLQKQLTEGAK